MTYLNGRIPLTALTPIPWDPAERLTASATAALVRLNEAYRAQFGTDLIVNEGYRDYATQVSYKARTALPVGHPLRLGSAAKPGTSQHGEGLAVDLGGLGGFAGTRYRWLVDHAGRFGWYQPAQYQRGGRYPEPWHWEYSVLRDLADTPATAAPAPVAPRPPAPPAHDPFGEDPTMYERALTAAYRTHLGRVPSDVELDERILRIAADDQPAARLRYEINGIAASDEAKARPIVALYRQHLGRTPSAVEVGAWLNTAGADLARIEAGITGSEEYRRLAAENATRA